MKPYLVGLLALAAAAAAVLLNLPPRLPATASTLGATATPSLPPPATATSPSWNAAAFRGLGSLAFVSHGLLYVMRGGAVTQITHSGTTIHPEWSHDGQWLAFVRASGAPYAQGGQLWLTRADGSDAHAVPGAAGQAWFGPSGESYAWSPTADVLAATPLTSPGPGGLYLVPPTGAPVPTAFAGRDVGSPVWSPDGTTVAVAVTAPGTRADTLETVAVRTGAATVQYRAPALTGLIIAGYSPDGGRIAFWVDPDHSASIAADGLPLSILDLATRAVSQLPKTLTYPAWLSWSPGGGSLAVVEGVNRWIWAGKGVVACDPTGRLGCTALLRAAGVQAGSYGPQFGNPGMVTLDPAWSPSGKTIALVQAVGRGNVGGWGGCPQATCSATASQAYATQQLAAWLKTRVLWLVDPNGEDARPLRSAGTGIYDPRWSAGGSHIVYIRNDAIWEVPVAGGPAERVAGPIDAGPDAPYGFYGYLRWSEGWAWYR